MLKVNGGSISRLCEGVFALVTIEGNLQSGVRSRGNDMVPRRIQKTARERNLDIDIPGRRNRREKCCWRVFLPGVQIALECDVVFSRQVAICPKTAAQ